MLLRYLNEEFLLGFFPGPPLKANPMPTNPLRRKGFNVLGFGGYIFFISFGKTFKTVVGIKAEKNLFMSLLYIFT